MLTAAWISFLKHATAASIKKEQEARFGMYEEDENRDHIAQAEAPPVPPHKSELWQPRSRNSSNSSSNRSITVIEGSFYREMEAAEEESRLRAAYDESQRRNVKPTVKPAAIDEASWMSRGIPGRDESGYETSSEGEYTIHTRTVTPLRGRYVAKGLSRDEGMSAEIIYPVESTDTDE